MKKQVNIKEAVRERYAQAATQGCGCGSAEASCCGGADESALVSLGIGYTMDDIKSVPEGANLGLGCGNPVALASLKEGETVLDLGSGAGFDAFLSAQRVGKKGKVIGVDMTPEMLAKANENAEKGGYKNVEFRLGEIERLPVDDNSVDVIISNCVINLSPDKPAVFKEAYRVLKPGGRLMVSDMVLLRELPAKVKKSIDAYASCIAGAAFKNNYLQLIKDTGFKKVKTVNADEIDNAEKAGLPVTSIKVQAFKP
ncbi:MAG: arsenite methyltransferase [Dehalococcoidales bacterium]|nr:arsenite methyltransferase [Dehalococcoidales bacterium]